MWSRDLHRPEMPGPDVTLQLPTQGLWEAEMVGAFFVFLRWCAQLFRLLKRYFEGCPQQILKKLSQGNP